MGAASPIRHGEGVSCLLRIPPPLFLIGIHVHGFMVFKHPNELLCFILLRMNLQPLGQFSLISSALD